MAFVQARLPRLPAVFITLDDRHDASPAQRTLQRSRSFSGYTPFELSAPDASFDRDSTGEASETPAWPDTDEEPEVPSAFIAPGPLVGESNIEQGVPVLGGPLLTPLAPRVAERVIDMMGGDPGPAGHLALPAPAVGQVHWMSFGPAQPSTWTCSPARDTSAQILRAQRIGAVALRNARAMMPAVDVQPTAQRKNPQRRRKAKMRGEA
ncbi:unnamed protein product [Symbiodinium natans]|uniref:Uncharacterized protein n=1 Tax=Symbiodinium natans TaxID=878477 RepID=A0A812FT88_9DINO|nr:unnamed protein product [Symbiodinium natans]